MPHMLTTNQKSRHFEELSSLILRNNKKPFLDQIEMCDEKRKVDGILQSVTTSSVVGPR